MTKRLITEEANCRNVINHIVFSLQPLKM